MGFMQKIKNLHRIDQDDVFGGVCAGIALTFNLPLWLLRVALVAAILTWNEVVIAYIILCFCIPERHINRKDYERELASRNKPAKTKVQEKTIEEHANSFDFNAKEKEINK
jgi:phage shock protein PspC (stress-responsive transcriptional regulator)